MTSAQATAIYDAARRLQTAHDALIFPPQVPSDDTVITRATEYVAARDAVDEALEAAQ